MFTPDDVPCLDELTEEQAEVLMAALDAHLEELRKRAAELFKEKTKH